MKALPRLTMAALGVTLGLGLLQACGDDSDDDDDSPSELEIAGDWENNDFDEPFSEVISSEEWDAGFIIKDVVSYDNADNWAVLQIPDDADEELGPGTYDRVVWTEIEDDAFYYCITDYGLETAEEAEESDSEPDADDFAEGCFDFPWTKLTREGA